MKKEAKGVKEEYRKSGRVTGFDANVTCVLGWVLPLEV